MAPGGRHKFTGRHEAGKQPAGQAWTYSPGLGGWRAYRGGLVLTVSRLSGGGYRAEVDGPDVQERADAFDTRLSAQEWCERRAGNRPGT
jgi:hypothetical protein